MRNIIIGVVISILLSGCEIQTTQRYSILADNNLAIKALGVSGIGIGQFTGPPTFDADCRSGRLDVADGLTHSGYIKKAFEDELKMAGAFTQASPRVTLTGNIPRIEFSSSLRGFTGGSWTIDLVLASSNGNRMNIAEHYEFNVSVAGRDACRQTADAFLMAVQNLVGKTVRSPDFVDLIR